MTDKSMISADPLEQMLYGVLGAALKTALETSVALEVTEEFRTRQERLRAARSPTNAETYERPESMTRKYAKLQLSFLALAREAAGYDGKPGNSAAGRIGEMLKRMGIPADDGTIRKQLKDANAHAMTVKGYRPPD